MSRTMSKIVTIACVSLALVTCAGLITNAVRSNKESLEEQGEIVRTYLTGENEFEISTSELTTFGAGGYKEIVIIGSDENASLIAVGDGYGTICAANAGTLIFQDLRIEDATPRDRGMWNDYLAFGGNIRFERCEFVSPLYLTCDANVVFEDCEFRMGLSDDYAVWLGDGNATFQGCEFTGQRGIYVNEFEGDDVVKVFVDKCRFLGLNVKPGIVVGEIYNDPRNTTVIIQFSEFEWCSIWDQKNAVSGIDGVYEAYTEIETFNFRQFNNRWDRTDAGWTPFY